MASETISQVIYVTSAAEVLAAYETARQAGLPVLFWGNGRSYGDAALNESGVIIDFSKMDRILEFDRGSGRVTIEPGVTIQKLWQTTLTEGFWPPVVSGTMFTTFGGLIAANAHGKNNWKYGPIGEHIEMFELVTPDGLILEVTPDRHRDLFEAVIGGFGLLGAVTKIVMKLKKVHSGRLEVQPISCDSLESMFRGFEKFNGDDWDYVVGWMDGFPSGPDLGRGQIHAARYVAPGEDPEARTSLATTEQVLPERFMGIVPMSSLWFFARPWANRLGMRLINFARFWSGARSSHQHRFLQPHAQFNFLLDFVPNWKWHYKPGGLIQIQLFVPKDRARDVFRRTLEICQQARLEPWLIVMKRHRADRFWMSHALDGYSLAMDFPVSDSRREDLWRLGRILTDLVADSGGRFYFAKDSLAHAEAVKKSLGEQTLAKFYAKKREVDPDDLIQGNLFRRLFGPIRASMPQLEERVEMMEQKQLEAVPVSNSEEQ